MTSRILEASQISKSFPVSGDGPSRKLKRNLLALEGVSFYLNTGETLGIAGESGCGKSTLAKIATGLLKPDSGSISFHGEAVDGLSPESHARFRRSVQMIFQDPFSSLNPRIRIGDAISEPILIHRIASGQDSRSLASELMEQVGISPDLYDRFPHEFSGGQRQRVGIARAIAASPSVILADEPVSSLDISIQAQIINLLQELKRKRGLSMAIISHDMGVLRHMCDRIAVMYLGRIVEEVPAKILFTGCRHPYTEALLSAIPSIRGDRQKKRSILSTDVPSQMDIPSGCSFHPRCPHAEDICRNITPTLRQAAPGHLSACHLHEKIYL